jgi:polyhydroxybutyrate depolymerase
MTFNQIFTLAWQDRSRRYLVHAPRGRYEDRGPWPVVLFLHGAGGTAEWALSETQWDVTADQRGFLLVLPDAGRADPAQPPGFLKNPQVWNDGSPHSYGGRPLVDDVGFINHLLDDLPRHFVVDSTRTYVTGFSNGAGMTFRLGTELSDRFAALAPVAGRCWQSNPDPAVRLPTLYAVGAEDPMLPLDGGEIVSPWDGTIAYKPPVRSTLDKWAKALGCDLAAVESLTQDGIRELRYRCGVEFRAYVIDGLGHHWPGGRGQLSRRLAGSPSDRVDGNALIANFFEQHRGI